MGKADIIDSLSELSLADRSEILTRLLELEAAESQQPSASEKQLLDDELERHRADPMPGTPWEVVERRLRRTQ